MLTINEVHEKAWGFGNEKYTTFTKMIAAEGFESGYLKCQETIPSECIGFAEWTGKSGYVSSCDKEEDGALKTVWHKQRANTNYWTTEEMYSIYIESLKQKP